MHYWVTMALFIFVTHQRSAEKINDEVLNCYLMVCSLHIEIRLLMQIFHIQNVKLLSKLCLSVN